MPDRKTAAHDAAPPHPAPAVQEGPRISDPWQRDALLRSVLCRHLPPRTWEEVEPRLAAFGARAAAEVRELGDAAEAEPPRHQPYDAWGRRVDRLVVSRGWTALKAVSAEEGLVALGYERPWGAWSRLVQHGLLYLFHPLAATYLCPLAMTDGAARLVETQGEGDLARRVLPRLVSRDPARFWTSGQWMTEQAGGSDVGGTATVARPDGAGWRLWGTKWFTSAIDADVAFTLARPEGAPDGSRGLALFFVELRDASGSLQGIAIRRLKEKLGTRALPTAELDLLGTPARMVGAPGEGVRRIATLMNVTRVYNTTAAVSGMAHAHALAADYATRRRAFGRPLAEHPLHRETLLEMEAERACGLALWSEVLVLQGRDEVGEASAEERAALRALVPVAKLYTAKQAVAVASEALEGFGGAGYVEDTGLPRLLRDAQVLPIWEGTTNVLSLDLVRALRDPAGLAHLAERASGVPWDDPSLPAGLGDRVRREWSSLLVARERALSGRGEAEARRYAYTLARAVALPSLAIQVVWAGQQGDPSAAAWTESLARLARRPSPTPMAAPGLDETIASTPG